MIGVDCIMSHMSEVSVSLHKSINLFGEIPDFTNPWRVNLLLLPFSLSLIGILLYLTHVLKQKELDHQKLKVV